jgi:4'-phosphopantetheinyl transferase
MVELFAIRLMDEESFHSRKEQLLEFLPVENWTFFTRFKRTTSLQRSLLGEVLLRYILGCKLGIQSNTIIFRKSDNGKPYLENKETHFNLSHSGDWVVMAFSDGEVGIDVEVVRPVNYRIAERFFSLEEVASLNSKEGDEKLDYFFDLWTLKESFLKLIGTGLTRSLNSFTIYHDRERFRIKEKGKLIDTDIFFRQFPVEKGYKLSVCSYKAYFAEKMKVITVKDLISA